MIEINFVEEPKYKSIIEDGYSAASIVRNISLWTLQNGLLKEKRSYSLMSCRSSRNCDGAKILQTRCTLRRDM